MMKNLGGEVFYPQPQFCTDNGAMIAYTGFLRLKQGQHSDLAIDVKPRWAWPNSLQFKEKIWKI